MHAECSELEPLLAAYVDGEVGSRTMRGRAGAPGRLPGLPARASRRKRAAREVLHARRH